MRLLIQRGDSPAQGPAELAGSGAQPEGGREGTPAGRRVGRAHAALDMLAAQDRLDDARSLLSSALAKEPRNLRYRLALARLTQRQGQGPAALQILEPGREGSGPSPDIQLARLDYWGLAGGRRGQGRGGQTGGDPAPSPAADRPAFLDRLGVAEIRLGQLNTGPAILARAGGAPAGEPCASGSALFDLAMTAGDQDDAAALVERSARSKATRGPLAVRAGGPPDRQGPARTSRRTWKKPASSPPRSRNVDPSGRVASP